MYNLSNTQYNLNLILNNKLIVQTIMSRNNRKSMEQYIVFCIRQRVRHFFNYINSFKLYTCIIALATAYITYIGTPLLVYSDNNNILRNIINVSVNVEEILQYFNT